MLAEKMSRNGWQGILGLKYDVQCNRCDKDANIKAQK